MKQLLLCSILFILGQNLSAQTDELAWFTNLEAAKTYATEHQENIMMVFAGSDWCRPCMQFKKDILETETFQTAAKDKLVVLYLDFPARKKNKLSEEATAHNEALAARFNSSGAFPNIVILDTAENVLSNPTYKQQTAEEFVTQYIPSTVAKETDALNDAP